MKRLWRNLIFLAGFVICCFPIISNLVNQSRQNELIATYQENAEEKMNETEEIINEARKYNQLLYQSGGGVLESHNLLNDEVYRSYLDLTGTGIMGTLEIPKINVNLPIYHGTDETVLANGVGHLLGTSFPVGGENTHSAISGHRGLPSAKLLVRLDEIVLGDYFFIRIGKETLAYKVCKVNVVEPDDVSKLDIEAGEDLISIITCTPYGLNTHRLIVTGTRVAYEKASYEAISAVIPSGREILLTSAPFLFLLVIFVVFVVDKRKQEFDDGKI